MLVNDARDVRCWIIGNNEGNGFSLYPGFVFKCVSARNVRSPLYLGFEKGFVVATSNKVIYKFSSTHYVTVVVGANAAKAKLLHNAYY